MKPERGSAFEEREARVLGSRSLGLLNAFIEMPVSLKLCQLSTPVEFRHAVIESGKLPRLRDTKVMHDRRIFTPFLRAGVKHCRILMQRFFLHSASTLHALDLNTLFIDVSALDDVLRGTISLGNMDGFKQSDICSSYVISEW